MYEDARPGDRIIASKINNKLRAMGTHVAFDQPGGGWRLVSEDGEEPRLIEDLAAFAVELGIKPS